MTDQQPQPAPERPESAAFHPDWFTSLWMRALPRHQSFMLSMVLGTAAAYELTGTLDDITHTVSSGKFSNLFRTLGDNLDSPTLWLEPDDLDEVETPEEEARLRTDVAEHQAACEAAYRAAGFEPPTTIRELADLMLALGIATHHDDGRWTMPEHLPLPEEALQLPAEMDADMRRFRRDQALEPFENAILNHLVEELDYPEYLFTSLDRLTKATDLTLEDLQAGLDRLAEQGDVRMYRGEPRVQVNARDLLGHERFHLVPDWEHYSEHRIHIVSGRRSEDSASTT